MSHIQGAQKKAHYDIIYGLVVHHALDLILRLFTKISETSPRKIMMAEKENPSTNLKSVGQESKRALLCSRKMN
jgi:hypothetical protein